MREWEIRERRRRIKSLGTGAGEAEGVRGSDVEGEGGSKGPLEHRN